MATKAWEDRLFLPGPRILELRELADVGAGAECVARRADDECSHVGRGVHLLAGVDERVVHGPRHRVAGVRTIDRERRDLTR